MATIETVYLGGLRTEATHVQSGTKLVTDAPVDNHGKGESFSPTDLVATALGSCMMTLMGIAGQTHDIDVDGTRLSITKVMAADPRRIGEIKIDVRFPKNYEPFGKCRFDLPCLQNIGGRLQADHQLYLCQVAGSERP